MIYLDNAATSSPKAPALADAMTAHIAAIANPGRGGHRRAAAAERMLDDTRAAIARLIGVADHRRIIHTLNCTDGLNMSIYGVVATAEPAVPHIVSTVLEHNSINRPLVDLRDAGRITFTRVGCDDDGFLDPDEIVAALRPETVLVAFLHASNALGTIQPAAEICRRVRAESEALILLDAAQSIGVLPIDVEAMGVDLLAFPGHKALMGPTGTGSLYVGPRAFPDDGATPSRMTPWRHGGTGGDSASPTQPRVLPHFLEGGTPNTVGIAGLQAGVAWVHETGIDTVREHEQTLIGHVIDRLRDRNGVRIVGTTDMTRRIGALSLTFDGWEPGDLGAMLDEQDIAVRPGLHCAPLAHEAMGTAPHGTLRLSPGPFTTIDDIERFLSALDGCIGR